MPLLIYKQKSWISSFTYAQTKSGWLSY